MNPVSCITTLKWTVVVNGCKNKYTSKINSFLCTLSPKSPPLLPLRLVIKPMFPPVATQGSWSGFVPLFPASQQQPPAVWPWLAPDAALTSSEKVYQAPSSSGYLLMFSEFELSTPLSMRVTAPPLSEVGEQEWGAGQAGAAVTSLISRDPRR